MFLQQARGRDHNRLETTLQNPASARLRSYSLRNSIKAKTYDVRVSFQLSKPSEQDSAGILTTAKLTGTQWRVEEGPNPNSFLATRTDPELDTRCIRCHKPADPYWKCNSPGCDSGFYCSFDCHKQDITIHDALCSQVEAYHDDTRPGPNHFRAFLFPVNEVKPRVIWLRCEFDKKTGKICFKFDQENVIRWASDHGGSELAGWANPCGGQSLVYTLGQGHGVLLFGMEHESGNGPELMNRSINALAKPGHLTAVFGPVFIVRYYVQEAELLFDRFGDVNLRDLQHGIDNILAAQCHIVVPDISRHRYRTVPGLKINDRQSPWIKTLKITEDIEEVDAPLVSCIVPAFLLLYPCQIGLKWSVRPAPVPRGAVITRVANTTRLYRYVIVADSQATEQELLDPKLRVPGGILRRFDLFNSFILYDNTGKRIHKHHVLAVSAYFESFDKYGEDPVLELRRLSKKGFESFWEDYKQMCAAQGESIADIPSPYNVKHDDRFFSTPSYGQQHPSEAEQLHELMTRAVIQKTA